MDTGSISPKELWTFDEKITGLQVTLDGKRLYLGLRDRLAQLDVATGEIETIAPSGIGRIRRFEPALEQVMYRSVRLRVLNLEGDDPASGC